MKRRILIHFVCAFFIASVHAGTIAVDPMSGNAGLVSGFGGLTLGWEFQVTAAEGIVVDGLGFWDDASDGFLFGQTFPVGLWDASNGVLLRSVGVASGSSFRASLNPNGGWRVSAVSPLFLTPGLYRIGGLMPESGANPIIADGATVQSATGISLIRHLRQIGSTTLAMPDIPMNSPDDVNFGPTFTFTPGPLGPSGAVVAPSRYTSLSGTSGLNTLVRNSGAPRTYQMQFASAALGGLPIGAKITELRFRLSTNSAVIFGWPSNTVTWSTYFVTLAQAANSVSTMSLTFAANMVSPVVVKSGSISIGPNTFTAGADPNAFGSFIVFDRPYEYRGGDLVMHFTHTGSDASNVAILDAVNATAPGYGTDCKAVSATTFGATSGALAPATIAQIVFTYSPRASISRVETDFVIVGTGGPPGALSRIVASTDTTLPVSQWTPIATNQFDSNGGFVYTNSIDAGAPAWFFRIALP